MIEHFRVYTQCQSVAVLVEFVSIRSCAPVLPLELMWHKFKRKNRGTFFALHVIETNSITSR